MEIVHERCCGLDVHKKTVVACLIAPDAAGRPRKELRTFGTMTADLERLAAWLRSAGCTYVAMESTGVYWKPVYNVLEEDGACTLIVANAQHLKAVPGRKTDVRDAEWIADLLRHGLIRGSFVPGRDERELRELTRYRTSLLQERASEINRVQKTLEGANIKLAAVATDVVGVSGREMLRAMIAGIEDSAALARLARGRLQRKQDALEAALVGRMRAHQRFLLDTQLRHIEELDAAISRVSEEIEIRLRPFAEAQRRLQTIPGVGKRTAETILSEIGTDMSRFPTAGHLASWAGLCPGQYESAGKRKGGRTRHGSPWLKSALVEATRTTARSRTYLGAQYHRIAPRRGSKRAAVAVAHSIIVIVYHLLADDSATYDDLGHSYFDRRSDHRLTRRLVSRLEGLGYAVTLAPAA